MEKIKQTFLGNILLGLLKQTSSSEFCDTKMVFLVRTDLGMGIGKIASQVAHAGVGLYKQAIKEQSPYLDYWTRVGQTKVVLKVNKECEASMNTLYDNAVNRGLSVYRVYDKGLTQIESGTLTVVGIGPNNIEQIDKITKQFKLL